MKKYLFITVTSNIGYRFNNHLKLSEVHLVTKLAKENMEVNIKIKEVENSVYNLMFS